MQSLTVLKADSFASLQTIAKASAISLDRLRAHLSRIGHVLETLHRVSDSLTDDVRWVRVDMCFDLLAILTIVESDKWHEIVTDDENWPYCKYRQNQISCLSNDHLRVYADRTIVTDGRVWIVCWNCHGFQLMVMLLKNMLFNAMLRIDGRSQPVRDKFFRWERKTKQK
jgi:hypothetical protein